MFRLRAGCRAFEKRISAASSFDLIALLVTRSRGGARTALSAMPKSLPKDRLFGKLRGARLNVHGGDLTGKGY